MAFYWNETEHKLVSVYHTGVIPTGWSEVNLTTASSLLNVYPQGIGSDFNIQSPITNTTTTIIPNPSMYTWGQPFPSINPTLIPQPAPAPQIEILEPWINWINVRLDRGEEDEEIIWTRFNTKCSEHGFPDQWRDAHWKHVMITRKRTSKSKLPFLEKTFKEAFPKLRFAKVKGEIGIEIEAEGKNLFNSPIQYWGAVQDHSLRAVDGHAPLEYVLREPIDRKKVMSSLEYLDSKLRAAGSELVMSHRCSVHVHVNVQEMPMLYLINYMCLYYILENILIEWSGPDRKGNLFCLRAQDADFQVEIVANALKKDSWGAVFNQEFRYAAMNTASLGKHGSLEFRSMRGNVDIQFINFWVELLCFLKDISSTFKSPSQISDTFRKLGPREFFRTIFAKKFGAKLVAMMNYQNFDQMMWESYRSMRDIAHAVDWTDPPKHMKETNDKKKFYESPSTIDLNEDVYIPEEDNYNEEENNN